MLSALQRAHARQQQAELRLQMLCELIKFVVELRKGRASK